ncbi:MAG: HesA/MoeB/ThiF family protein [Gammaproteobacteria bacterium]|nr:HesA/MoeB/ThiF family protein [Gammaproteobacteria bacterium]
MPSRQNKTDNGFSNAQLSRYSRHILLPEIDIAGQQRLRDSHVLLIGAGGLGSPVALYLVSSGIGQLSIFDPDTVELGNLQRQIAFREQDLNHPKAFALRDTLHALNPDVLVTATNERFEGERLSAAIANADVVIDASDNFATRFAVNEACVKAGVPLVSGSAIGFRGQVSVFFPDHGPCYRCLYKDEDEAGPRCVEVGIFAPLTGIIGGLQAAEALKLVLQAGKSLAGRVITVDALTMEIRTLSLKRDPDCPVCGD